MSRTVKCGGRAERIAIHDECQGSGWSMRSIADHACCPRIGRSVGADVRGCRDGGGCGAARVRISTGAGQGYNLRRRIGIIGQGGGSSDGADRGRIEDELVIAGGAEDDSCAAPVAGTDEREVRGVAEQDRGNLVQVGIARVPQGDGESCGGLPLLHLAEVKLRFAVGDIAERIVACVHDEDVCLAVERER